MEIAIEIDADDATPLCKDAEAERIAIETFAPKRFNGAAELVVVVLPITIATLPWICKIIIARITANRHVKVKFNGIEIQGLSASNAQKILFELLASDERPIQKLTPTPAARKLSGKSPDDKKS